jgi:hypothetical protein
MELLRNMEPERQARQHRRAGDAEGDLHVDRPVVQQERLAFAAE